ncbi:MAG TPA: response regulator [Nitrospirota bacterium]|nr:response regulator [Nitrospirota bacterium]
MKKILLVDDDLDIYGALENIFSIFGYEIILKEDAASALAVIREGNEFNVVVADYQVVGMEGQDFLRALKKISPAVPVIMLSEYNSVETYLKSLSLGAFEYLHKPVEEKELSRVVKAAIAWWEEMNQPVSVA